MGWGSFTESVRDAVSDVGKVGRRALKNAGKLGSVTGPQNTLFLSPEYAEGFLETLGKGIQRGSKLLGQAQTAGEQLKGLAGQAQQVAGGFGYSIPGLDMFGGAAQPDPGASFFQPAAPAAPEPENNTMLYVGIGVAALAVLYFALRK